MTKVFVEQPLALPGLINIFQLPKGENSHRILPILAIFSQIISYLALTRGGAKRVNLVIFFLAGGFH